MTPETAEWVAKADADYAAAVRLNRTGKVPLWETVGFHCQQCVEKYIKARLNEAGLAFPKTHDLEALLDLVLPIEPFWEPFRASLIALSDYAVKSRYPGDSVTQAEAKRALADCRTVRKRIRASLGLVAKKRKRTRVTPKRRTRGGNR